MSTLLDPARPTFPRKAIGILQGYQNGKLDDRVLVKSNVRNLLANSVSVRKFNALQSKAIREGIPLSATGIYRSLERQAAGILDRYDKGYIAGRKHYVYYLSSYWSLKPGYAQMATPGTSQHGWARAVDWAVMLDGDTTPDSLRTSDKVWLAKNAPAMGIYFNVPSEDWHGEDYDGDTISQAVLDEEAGLNGNPVPPFDPKNGLFSLYPLDKNKARLFLKVPQFHSDLVGYLQGVLKKYGFAISVDHVFGGQTDRFVREFQQRNGLTIDGIVGSYTWAVLDNVANNLPPVRFDPLNGVYGNMPLRDKPTTREPATGDFVLYAQSVMKYRCSQAILIDGRFGPVTTDNVKWFQMVNGLTIDGIIGQYTWAVIDRYAK